MLKARLIVRAGVPIDVAAPHRLHVAVLRVGHAYSPHGRHGHTAAVPAASSGGISAGWGWILGETRTRSGGLVRDLDEVVRLHEGGGEGQHHRNVQKSGNAVQKKYKKVMSNQVEFIR